MAAEHPYQDWLDKGLVPLERLPPGNYVRMPHHRVVLRQLVFGYTYEELNLLVAPMVAYRRRADRIDGHRHSGCGALDSVPACSTTTSTNSSPR